MTTKTEYHLSSRGIDTNVASVLKVIAAHEGESAEDHLRRAEHEWFVAVRRMERDRDLVTVMLAAHMTDEIGRPRLREGGVVYIASRATWFIARGNRV